jgi:sulfite reductase (NADPH) flavoprotein alpha-component
MLINILWASMTGNAEDVADNFEVIAKKRNHEVNLVELNDVTADKLQEMKLAVVVTSTTGDGDLPHNGDEFWDWLENSTSQFKNLAYSVCALGDSSHQTFCGAGNKINSKLDELGATRIKNIIECDCGTEGSEEWFKELLKEIE